MTRIKPIGNRYGTRWRGKLPIPVNAHPLVRRFFQEMNSQKTTLTEVAERAGMQRATISEWRYRRNPSLPQFEAALNVLDLELAVRRVPENRKGV